MLRVSGTADPVTVWSRYAEIGRWPEWAPQIRAVERSAEAIGPSVGGTVIGPAGLRIAFEVLDVDVAAMCWSWRVGTGPLQLRMRHQVLAGRSGGSITTLEIDGPGRAARLTGLLAEQAYRPVAWSALRRLVALGPPA